MKKLLSLLLVLCVCLSLCVAFTSCDNGLSEEEWATAVAAASFTNYTLTYSANFVNEDYPEASGQQNEIIKITQDKVYIAMTLNGEVMVDHVFTGEEANEQRASYQDIFLAVLKDFDNFVYDDETQTYSNPNPITVDITVSGATAHIVMTNGKVSFTEDGKLAKLTMSYTQSTTIPVIGETITTTCDSMTMVFSDYGTTVIE